MFRRTQMLVLFLVLISSLAARAGGNSGGGGGFISYFDTVEGMGITLPYAPEHKYEAYIDLEGETAHKLFSNLSQATETEQRMDFMNVTAIWITREGSDVVCKYKRTYPKRDFEKYFKNSWGKVPRMEYECEIILDARGNSYKRAHQDWKNFQKKN